ncbi:MAG: hypothetical protein Q4C15_13255 [Eubacteriales bacterium]|nr:hypothetical protein [Eubacteriales bacterium]
MKRIVISLEDPIWEQLEEDYSWNRVNEKNINEYILGLIKEHLGIDDTDPMDCLDSILNSDENMSTDDFFESWDPD